MNFKTALIKWNVNQRAENVLVTVVRSLFQYLLMILGVTCAVDRKGHEFLDVILTRDKIPTISTLATPPSLD
jgi:hypothetical protein